MNVNFLLSYCHANESRPRLEPASFDMTGLADDLLRLSPAAQVVGKFDDGQERTY